MLVYGDPVRTEDPASVLARVGEAWREAAAAPAGVARHALVVGALIEAGELAQGLADARFEARGRVDDLDEGDRAAMALCLALARSVQASWESGFQAMAPPDEALLAACAAGGLPERVRIKLPEAYAFYAHYPEATLAAARRLPPVAGRTRVVGIRSVGTSLAAIAAAALDDPAPVTVRPVGHPFRREVRLTDRLAADLAGGAGRIVVVDEGPGLSGSSFGAVADALEALGVERERIAFLPSHPGDLGPQASERHRARWRAARRPVVGLDALVLDAENPVHRLDGWIADLAGPSIGPLEDLSGGAWRRLAFGGDEASWPAAAAHQERRKLLARTASGPLLAKFVGLGREGARKAAQATALAQAGFAPPVLGLRHGFLVQIWAADARPLGSAASPPLSRGALLDTVARYLAFRARAFPARPEAGASGGALLEMARHNAGEALGEAAGEAVADRLAGLPALDRDLRRIATDNRLHAHEWLAGPRGRLWKADAVDHHAAHDMIGCQDVAWDVAGAEVELALDRGEVEALCRMIEARGAAVDRRRLEGLRPAYLAFQLGHARMAADALASWPAEAGRLSRLAERYAGALRSLLAGGP